MPKPGAAPDNRSLPKKEAVLFKSVVKYYEMKQYKKSVKTADAILKKFPNHGETLAMKGLTLNCLEKREEAHALVKQGLMYDMTSHVCWHVYGLLHRSDRNYNEAIKAYKQALRIDKENLQILRDLSLLQIQMRDLNGFAVTRHTLLSLKPSGKINWLAFALAKHLTGDLRGAISVIDIYLGTLVQGSSELERGFESSELAMYRNSILTEIPDNYQEALNHLDECESLVVDRGAWLMERSKCYLKLGRYQDARQTFMSLLQRGHTEDYRVHSGYMCSLLELDNSTCDEALQLKGTGTVVTMMPISAEQRKLVLHAYRNELSAQFPKSHTVKRIQLSLFEGDELRAMLDTYCRKAITKGVPSLWSDLSSLFLVDVDGRCRLVEDPVDVKEHSVYNMVVDLADGYISSLSSKSKFSESDDSEEAPSTILWAWFLRAGFHELAGELAEGIALMDKCLEHTPTAVDVYEMKARLLKAAGDMNAAVECLDKGREMDLQDRYINNQTTKYMLQAGMNETALERISLFTRHEGNPEQNLFDMQCTWYELELAASLARKEEWGPSLKKYAAVVKHFDDFHEDQFDFHSYCIRKVTLRAYTKVLRFEDNLWAEQYYGRAAEGMIRAYLHLHDNPAITAGEVEPDYSSMTAAERKKAKAIQRKKKKAAEKKAAEEAERQEAKEAAATATAENGNKKKKGGQPVVVDKDPEGKELLNKDALEEATKYSSILAKHASHRVSTWILQYDVSMRRGKALMALQALFKARAIDASNGELISRIVDFALKADTLGGDSAVVRLVISEETPTLLGGGTVSDYVSSTFKKTRKDPLTSLAHRVAVAKALVLTKTASVSEAASLIVDHGMSARGVSVTSCSMALTALAELGGDAADAKAKWISKSRDRFPLAAEFR